MIKEIEPCFIIRATSRTDLCCSLPLASFFEPVKVVLIITSQAVIRSGSRITLEATIFTVDTYRITEVGTVIGIKRPNCHIITHITGSTHRASGAAWVTWHTCTVIHVTAGAVVVGNWGTGFVGGVVGESGEASSTLGIGARRATCFCTCGAYGAV
ncbi:MAG: hypothetical protein QF535_08370 [Anaerolineales bacterium]|nr:hypothetical protein [Anaerolineales bacterium]